mmetsp:Transcript_33252/g.81713  ORF Transcript_33252/g.81713 Transcript_33252/m.81713 type:complete len:318 (-) Transcript_33252:129-1082(-)|eukprot:CAMPEP_0197600024 /NCGR_PEP_ID=MMETSP1326-20131121/32515_1 /TAXON_ID=1155430 /ORGANISM="Genus nov. species nov., Strain RCC2288" /LENGTH=317 /DNA_ID=CAMNT_0043167075 /DNA_START=129 /DNA_END=1082 /DNA_ORIENTATION=-
MVKLSPLAHQTNAHADSIWSVAWTGTLPGGGGDLLLTGSVDENVKSWRASGDGLEMVHSYTGHTLGVVALAVSANGLVASSALDSFIRVWDVETHETKCVIESPPAENWELAFQPVEDPQHIAVAGGTSGAVKLFSINDGGGALLATMSLPAPSADKPKHGRFVQSVAYSGDGRRVACGAMDGTVAVFDTGSGKLLHTLEGHAMPVRSLAFSVDSKTLFTACDDGHIHMYDVEHRSLMEALPGHRSWVLGVAASPSGNALVSCSSDSTVKLWDLGQRSCVQTMTDQSDAVWGVCFKPDGSRVASVSDDKSISLYDFV